MDKASSCLQNYGKYLLKEFVFPVEYDFCVPGSNADVTPLR